MRCGRRRERCCHPRISPRTARRYLTRHRFGSPLNHHVHLHACVPDGVFVPAADQAGCDSPPAFLPARPITQADLAALTERVRRRVIRWFRMQRLLDAAAAADMRAWDDTGFSVDASVRARVGEEFPLECPNCGVDIRRRGDGRQEPAHFEPEVRKREKARMVSPA